MQYYNDTKKKKNVRNVKFCVYLTRTLMILRVSIKTPSLESVCYVVIGDGLKKVQSTQAVKLIIATRVYLEKASVDYRSTIIISFYCRGRECVT